MSDGPETTRRYSDREVRLILKSAADLQERSDVATDRSGGLSLTQLEQIGREAGLDPSLIRRAAARIDAPDDPTGRNAFLGSPTEIVVERIVNHPIDVARFDDLLSVVRSVTRVVGEVSTVGHQFGWKGRLDGAKTEVAISVGDRATTVRVRVALDEVAVLHFMLKGMLLGVGGGMATGAAAGVVLGPFGLLVSAGVAGSGYLWARHGLARAEVRFRGRAIELIDALIDGIGPSR